MPQDYSEHSWFGPASLKSFPALPDEQGDFNRLWQAFMNARLVLGLVLVLLQITLFATGSAHSKTLLLFASPIF